MPEGNKKIIKKSIEVFSNHNYNTYSNYLAENVKWNIVGMPVITGKDEFIKILKSFGLENFSLANIKNIISEGEFVVVESCVNAHGQAGISSQSAYCDIYRLKHGKILELTSYIVDTTSTDDCEVEIMSHKFKENNNV